MAALSTTYATARHSSCRCTGADLNLVSLHRPGRGDASVGRGASNGTYGRHGSNGMGGRSQRFSDSSPIRFSAGAPPAAPPSSPSRHRPAHQPAASTGDGIAGGGGAGDAGGGEEGDGEGDGRGQQSSLPPAMPKKPKIWEVMSQKFPDLEASQVFYTLGTGVCAAVPAGAGYFFRAFSDGNDKHSTLKDSVTTELCALKMQYVQLDCKLDKQFAKLDTKMDQGMSQLDCRVSQLDCKLDKQFAQLVGCAAVGGVMYAFYTRR